MIVNFTYRNHREDISDRVVDVTAIRWEPGNEDYKHPQGYVLHGHDRNKNAPRSFLFTNIIPKPGNNVLVDFTQLVDKRSITALLNKAMELVTSIENDNNHSGDLLSAQSLRAAAELRHILEFYAK